MSNTKLISGRTVRWDDERAADAYARGWWVRETLADSLADAAHRTPQRVVLIDGDYRLDCHTLHEQATSLAQARPKSRRSSAIRSNGVSAALA